MDKLEGLKEGDMVEITFRGVVDECDGKSLDIAPENGTRGTCFDSSEIASPSFSIKKVEPPLKPGDRVYWGLSRETFELAALNGDQAALWDGRVFISADAETLTRA